MLRSQGQSVVTRRHQKHEYQYKQVDPTTGLSCNKVFKRAWNLKRHQYDQHHDQRTVFINYDQIALGVKNGAPLATGARLPRIPAMDLPMSDAPMQERAATHSPAQIDRAQWHSAPIKPSQALNSTLMMAPMSPASATMMRIVPTPARSVSNTQAPRTSVPHIPPRRIPATSASHGFSSSLPQMRSLESSPWMRDTSYRDSSSPPTLPIYQEESIQSPMMSMPAFTPPEIGPSRYLTQSANRVAPYQPQAHFAEDSEDQTSQSDAIEYRTPSQTTSTSQFESDFNNDEASDISGSDREEEMLGLQTSGEDLRRTGRKRKRSTERGRIIDARLKANVPMYPVKRSKKTHGQQRAIDWLTAAGKAYFDSTHAMFLAQWGVKAGHRGTCVLLPEDWKAMDPVDLMETFDDYQLPSGGSGRAWYSYSDHATTLARALAWYGEPRRGADLDNFIDCGPYKRKDGSHLCHHEHCIIHVTYELADINWDRWNCCLEARFLRQDGREVPEHCTKYSPPCLMQVSCLLSLVL